MSIRCELDAEALKLGQWIASTIRYQELGTADFGKLELNFPPSVGEVFLTGHEEVDERGRV